MIQIQKYINIFFLWILQLMLRIVFVKYLYELLIMCNFLRILWVVFLFILIDFIFTKIILYNFKYHQINNAIIWFFVREGRLIFSSIIMLLYMYFFNHKMLFYLTLLSFYIICFNKNYAYHIYYIFIFLHLIAELIYYLEIYHSFSNVLNILRCIHIVFWWQMKLVNLLFSYNLKLHK